jgi:zinc/manganese transport system substrate-binding protein
MKFQTLICATAISLALPAMAQAEEKLNVVASFSIIGDFARVVGGDRIDLTTLVGADADAHVFEPRPQDAVTVSRADVVLVNGMGFEGFLPRLIEAANATAPIIELTAGVTPIETDEHSDDDHAGDDHSEHGHDDHAEHKHDAHGHGHDDHGHEEHAKKDDHSHGDHAGHNHGPLDPHAWQDVRNAKIYVANIVQAFCTADAAGCDTYKANGTAYTATLDALDADIRNAVSALPENKRTIITAHDAFQYFSRGYDLTFLAPEGVATDSEASAADVAALIRQARDDSASAIFMESISDPRLVEQIARETGLAVGGALYSDALSDPDGPAPSYVEMMRHNLETILAAIKQS